MGDAWVFYDHVLKAANITAGINIPHLMGKCPTGNLTTVSCEYVCVSIYVWVYVGMQVHECEGA